MCVCVCLLLTNISCKSRSPEAGPFGLIFSLWNLLYLLVACLRLPWWTKFSPYVSVACLSYSSAAFIWFFSGIIYNLEPRLMKHSCIQKMCILKGYNMWLYQESSLPRFMHFLIYTVVFFVNKFSLLGQNLRVFSIIFVCSYEGWNLGSEVSREVYTTVFQQPQWFFKCFYQQQRFASSLYDIRDSVSKSYEACNPYLLRLCTAILCISCLVYHLNRLLITPYIVSSGIDIISTKTLFMSTFFWSVILLWLNYCLTPCALLYEPPTVLIHSCIYLESTNTSWSCLLKLGWIFRL